MLTEKILHKIQFAPKISPSILGFFAFVNFLLGIIFFVGLLEIVHEFPSAIFLIFTPFGIGFFCLIQYTKTKKIGTENFRNLYQKYISYKNFENQSIFSFREQQNLLTEMSAISSEVFDIPERKKIDFKKEQLEIEEKIANLKNQNQITTFDIIYEIVENLKKGKPELMQTENWEKNYQLSQKGGNSPKKIIYFLFIVLGFSLGLSLRIPIIGITNIVISIFLIINIYRGNFVNIFDFEFCPKNLGEFRHIVTNTGKYWQLSQKETENLPILSLLFTDIINLLSKNITERKNFLKNYKKFWKYKTSSLFLISSSKNFPVEVQQFFAEQNKKLIKDASDIRKFIILWKDLEIKKLAKLHLNAEIPELSLQSKRREILLKNLEKIK